MEKIEKMPTNGDMMISFSGNAEQIDLLFYAGKGFQKIQIYQKKFQTPSTGFNSTSELESTLYNEIIALLSTKN